jgi:hypothetical protein
MDTRVDRCVQGRWWMDGYIDTWIDGLVDKFWGEYAKVEWMCAKYMMGG